MVDNFDRLILNKMIAAYKTAIIYGKRLDDCTGWNTDIQYCSFNNKFYPRVRIEDSGKEYCRTARQIAYHIRYGLFPRKGLAIKDTCGNRACCNWNHLYIDKQGSKRVAHRGVKHFHGQSHSVVQPGSLSIVIESTVVSSGTAEENWEHAKETYRKTCAEMKEMVDQHIHNQREDF